MAKRCSILGVCSLATFAEPSVRYGHARTDRYNKRLTYQRIRVPEYWIVDLDARIVERWRPDDARPEILSQSLTWRPVENDVTLEIDLPAYFNRIFR